MKKIQFEQLVICILVMPFFMFFLFSCSSKSTKSIVHEKSVLTSKEALVDSIAVSVNDYVKQQMTEFIDDRYSLLNTPNILIDFFSNKDNRLKDFEENIKEYVNNDSICQRVNDCINAYNQENINNKINLITTTKVNGVFTDDILVSMNERDNLEALNSFLDFFAESFLCFLIVTLVIERILTRRAGKKIAEIQGFTYVGRRLVSKYTTEGGFFSTFLSGIIDTMSQNAIDKQIRRVKRKIRIAKFVITVIVFASSILIFNYVISPKENQIIDKLTDSYVGKVAESSAIINLFN